MKLLKLKRFWLILLLPLSYGLTCLAEAFPEGTERMYSSGLYPVLTGIFSRLTGILPFSLAELFLYLLFLGVIVYAVLYFLYIKKKQKQEPRSQVLIRVLANAACVAGIGYFLFAFLCGFNYHRLSFGYHTDLAVRDSSVEELTALCRELMEEVNSLRPLVSTDENGVMVLSFTSYKEAAQTAQQAYALAGQSTPVLSGYTPKPKRVLASRAMSYLDIVGIYIPYTFEANVNTDVVPYNIPFSMCHELAHFKGYMREDEANFISYWVCRQSEHPDFAYSGSVMALVYSTNALYSSDRDAYYEVMERLDPGVRLDFAANGEYWQQFAGPVAEVSTAVNNTYLKTNKQSDGVKSYGRVVDLLLADYRQRHGLD